MSEEQKERRGRKGEGKREGISVGGEWREEEGVGVSLTLGGCGASTAWTAAAAALPLLSPVLLLQITNSLLTHKLVYRGGVKWGRVRQWRDGEGMSTATEDYLPLVQRWSQVVLSEWPGQLKQGQHTAKRSDRLQPVWPLNTPPQPHKRVDRCTVKSSPQHCS